MSTKSGECDVADKITMFRGQIAQVLRSLVLIEAHRPIDDRSYTTFDLLEAIELTEKIVYDRLEEGYDEWRNDDKQQYNALFGSIRSQISETMSINFQNMKGESLIFVNSYNTLVVDRLVSIFRLLGPLGTAALLTPLIQEMKNTVSEIESKDPADLKIAQSVLDTFRKSHKPTTLTRVSREQVIRNICERLQELVS